MRGKGDGMQYEIWYNRITPAYAGKSIICPNGELVVEDHPRLCGEKASFPIRHFGQSGSPPPMRGKVPPVLVQAIPDRITPAYAGKSSAFANSAHTRRDHPRLCGEKQTQRADLITQTGSPPPMRGKVRSEAPFSSRARITPAYAGKSIFDLYKGTDRRDHPRLCGEKDHGDSVHSRLPGSPPPMRGKVLYTCTKYKLMRITPAYAGKRHAARCFNLST